MIASLIISLALWGQQDPTALRDCLDDNGVNRCDAENRAKVLAMLGMPSLEDEKAAGTEVYRTLQIDGYGNVVPSIAYERRVGHAPQVVVYAKGGVRLSASVSAEEWSRVQGMARFADRTLEPPPGAPNPADSICLHAWVSTVEITNAADRGVPNGPSRRRTEDACNGGLTTRFAFELPTLAIKHFPECDALDPEDHRNDATRLQQCATFKGDRLAAAQLMNQIGWRFTPRRDADKPDTWAALFGLNAETSLDWAGEQIAASRGIRGNAVAAYLARKQTENPSLRAWLSGFEGMSSTRVRVSGRLDMDAPDKPNESLSAEFEQVWVWNAAGLNWTLASWSIEPFTPVPPT